MMIKDDGSMDEMDCVKGKLKPESPIFHGKIHGFLYFPLNRSIEEDKCDVYKIWNMLLNV